MKPMHFVALAIVALVSVALAITTYAANNTWSPGRVAGARMFPALAAQRRQRRRHRAAPGRPRR